MFDKIRSLATSIHAVQAQPQAREQPGASGDTLDKSPPRAAQVALAPEPRVPTTPAAPEPKPRVVTDEDVHLFLVNFVLG